MTEIELKAIVERKLKEAQLSPFLSEDQQQYLEVPEERFFVEIVLTDASKLRAAEEVVKGVAADLAEQSIEMDYVVRGLWRVKEIEYMGSPPAESGGIKAADRFRAKLQSGDYEHWVEVDLSRAAQAELESRIGKLDATSMNKLVENFLVLQLSTGGASYWDPIRFRHLDINAAAISYLLHHSPTTTA